MFSFRFVIAFSMVPLSLGWTQAQVHSTERSAFSEAAAMNLFAEALIKRSDGDQLAWIAILEEIMGKHPDTRAAGYAKLLQRNPAAADTKEVSPSENVRALSLIREVLGDVDRPISSTSSRGKQQVVAGIPRKGLLPEIRYFADGVKALFSEYSEHTMEYERKTHPAYVAARNHELQKRAEAILTKQVQILNRSSSTSSAASKDTSWSVDANASVSPVSFAGGGDYRQANKAERKDSSQSREGSVVVQEFLPPSEALKLYAPEEVLEKKLDLGRRVLGDQVGHCVRLHAAVERIMLPLREDDSRLLAFLEQKRWKDALEIASRLLERDPHSLSYRLSAASAALHLGDLDEALAQAAKARQRDPSSTTCNTIEGIVFARRKLYARACQLLEDAYKSGQRSSPMVSYYLALGWLDQGSPGKAEEYAEAAVLCGVRGGQEPEEHPAVSKLIKANEAWAERVRDCVEEYHKTHAALQQKASNQESPEFKAWMRAAIAVEDLLEVEMFRQKKYRLAEVAWRCLAMHGARHDALRGWWQVSRALAAQGRTEEALDALAQAVENGASDVDAVEKDEYLRVLTKHPRWTEAASAMNKVKEARAKETADKWKGADELATKRLIGTWKFDTGATVEFQEGRKFTGTLRGSWKVERGVLYMVHNDDPKCDCKYGIRDGSGDRTLELWDVRKQKIMKASRER